MSYIIPEYLEYYAYRLGVPFGSTWDEMRSAIERNDARIKGEPFNKGTIRDQQIDLCIKWKKEGIPESERNDLLRKLGFIKRKDR